MPGTVTPAYTAGLTCPKCKHGVIHHGTSQGCVFIVRVSRPTGCGCREPRKVWNAERDEWVVAP